MRTFLFSRIMDSVTMEDLPVEMLIKIFTYLSLTDLKESSLVCKNWYDALYHPKTLDRMILALNNTNFDEYKTIMYKRSFYNLMCHHINFHQHHHDMKFWHDLGPNLQYLMFRDCTFTISQLILFLQTTKNIKTLIIEICNFVQPVENTSEFNSVKDILKNITKLKFEILTEDNYKLFNILIEIMPYLEVLETDNPYRSRNEIIYNNVKLRAKTLKKLCIYNDSPSKLIDDILNIENSHLTGINFHANLIPSLMKSIIIRQQTLTSLYLNHWAVNSDLITICNNMPNIEYLYIQLASELKDDGVKDLWKLKKLIYLHLGHSHMVSAKGYIEGLKDQNDNLQLLSLSHNSKGENLLTHISNKFHNLRDLKIESLYEIEENEFQNVWKNIRWLRSLNIFCKSTLHDFAFTGNEMDNLNDYSIAYVEGLQSLSFALDCDITMKALNEIAKLKELINLRLNLTKSKITLDNLKILTNCKSLERLHIIVNDDEIIANQEALKMQFHRIKIFEIVKPRLRFRCLC